MRILCLHGTGTSSQIFEAQTAALRHTLGDEHTYDFVQGTVPWPVAPGKAFKSVSKQVSDALRCTARSDLISPAVPSHYSGQGKARRRCIDSQMLLHFLAYPLNAFVSDDADDEHDLAELESLAMPNTTYWSYCDWTSPASIMETLDQLESYIAAEGPFDAVMGFSSGAALTVMYLLYRSRASVPDPQPFKCAILLNCIHVFNPVAYAESGVFKNLQLDDYGEFIRIPVANIWGSEDIWCAESELASQLCQSDLRSTYIHGGRHEVPGIGVPTEVVPTVQVMQRAFILADLIEDEK